MHLPQDLWPMGKNAWKVNYLKLTYFKFHTIVLICTINKNWFKLKYWMFWNRYTLQKIQMEIQTYWYENSSPFLQDHHCPSFSRQAQIPHVLLDPAPHPHPVGASGPSSPRRRSRSGPVLLPVPRRGVWNPEHLQMLEKSLQKKPELL